MLVAFVLLCSCSDGPLFSLDCNEVQHLTATPNRYLPDRVQGNILWLMLEKMAELEVEENFLFAC